MISVCGEGRKHGQVPTIKLVEFPIKIFFKFKVFQTHQKQGLIGIHYIALLNFIQAYRKKSPKASN